MSDDEARAKSRYLILGVLRIATIGAVILGLAIARGVIEGPYWLGVTLSVAGMIAFFFAPPLLAKRWKAGDRAGGEE